VEGINDRKAPFAGFSYRKLSVLIGRTDGGRILTLVVEATADAATWQIVTGWDSTPAERKLLETR
jgi:hypothetical protein